MQQKGLLLLLIALIIGGVAVVMVNRLLKQEFRERADADVIKTTSVIVAAKDLKPGTRLDNLSVQSVEWPQSNVPDGSYNDSATLLGEVPPVVLKEIRKNEPVLAYKLSPQGAKSGLPRKIPEDMRAITISVNEVTGVAGFVLPGNYVDVLLTSKIGRKDKKPTTRMLLQNIKVLGVDQISSEEEEKPKVVNAVTMLVSPDEGKRLTLAQSVGDLKLLLRNEFDASIVEQQLTTLASLESAAKAQKPTKVYKRVRRPVVEVIRGLDVEKSRVKEAQPLSSEQQPSEQQSPGQPQPKNTGAAPAAN